MSESVRRWLGAAYWVLTGAVASIGVAGILTIGFPLLLVALLLVIVGIAWPLTRNHGLGALLAGFAAAPLWLTWLNWGGPGEVCNASGTQCGDRYSPFPFLAAGLVLIVAGVWLSRPWATPPSGRAGVEQGNLR